MVAALVRSPSMAAAFTAHASTAVFAALPSTAAPSTPTATIAAGSGIPAATATCEFGSVDRRSRADEYTVPYGAFDTVAFASSGRPNTVCCAANPANGKLPIGWKSDWQ